MKLALILSTLVLALIAKPTEASLFGGLFDFLFGPAEEDVRVTILIEPQSASSPLTTIGFSFYFCYLTPGLP
jgi:hypothetical protein